MARFRILSAVLLALPVLSLAQRVQYTRMSGRSYAWTGHAAFRNTPSDETLMEIAWDMYDDMVSDAATRRKDPPSTMSAGWYPTSNGGGDLLLHSSVKGGGSYADQYINACQIGRHQTGGNCAEMSNMVTARGYGWSLSTAKIAVYGRTPDGHTTFLQPCTGRSASRRTGQRLTGCRDYVDGVGMYCVHDITKRFALPDALPEAEPEAFPEAEPEAFPAPDAEPEPVAEAKKKKKPKSSKKVEATKTSAAGKKTSSVETTGTATATETASPSSGAACPKPGSVKPDPKNKVNIDVTKLKHKGKVTKDTKMIEESDIVSKKIDPNASVTGSATGKSVKATATGESTKATATGKARSISFPRRHLLGAFGF